MDANCQIVPVFFILFYVISYFLFWVNDQLSPDWDELVIK